MTQPLELTLSAFRTEGFSEALFLIDDRTGQRVDWTGWTSPLMQLRSSAGAPGDPVANATITIDVLNREWPCSITETVLGGIGPSQAEVPCAWDASAIDPLGVRRTVFFGTFLVKPGVSQ